MSEKIYGFKDDKCKVEVPSKEEFDQLESRTKNIEVIRGQVVIEASNAESVEIDYPQGYTYQNCIPIACGILGSATAKGYNYVGNYEDSADGLNNAYKRRLNLNSSKIVLVVFNPNSSQVTVDYKIVLMITNEEAE